MRRFIVNLLVLGGAMVASFCLVEGVARVLMPEWGPRTAHITSFWQFDSTYGWSHVKGLQGVFPMDGQKTTVSINSKGFRGPEVQYEPRVGMQRVVVLGDSFVWGFGVEYKDTFQATLQRAFDSVEVIGLGVSGYSTDQELILYRNEGRKYRADLVIQVVAGNDLPSNLSTEEYLIYSKPAFVVSDGKLEPVNQPVVQTFWLKRMAVQMAWHSYVLTGIQRLIYQFSVEKKLATQAGGEPQKHVDQNLYGLAQVSRSACWQTTLRLLQETKAEVAKDGADYLVVFVEGLNISEEVEQYIKKLGFDAVFLDHCLDPQDTTVHLSDLLHWSPKGQALVAKNILEHERERNVSKFKFSTQSHLVAP